MIFNKNMAFEIFLYTYIKRYNMLKPEKNKQLGVRISQVQMEDYFKMCNKINSIPSMRIRKFIELELEFFKNGEDLLINIVHGK